MEKKGRKAVIALGAACAALIVVVSVLGAVYARDVTMAGDDGSVGTGTWSVYAETVAGASDYPLTFGAKTLRPEAVEYKAEAARTRDSYLQEFLDITNQGGTNNITSIVRMLDYEKNDDGSAKASLHWDEGFVWGEGCGDERDDGYTLGLMEKFGFTDGNETCEEQFEDLVNSYGMFSLTFAYRNDNNHNSNNPETMTNGYVALKPGEYDVVTWTTVYVMVTWTSVWEGKGIENVPPSGFESWGEYSDAVDTVIGTYADAISFSVTWEVAQNNEVHVQTD